MARDFDGTDDRLDAGDTAQNDDKTTMTAFIWGNIVSAGTSDKFYEQLNQSSPFNGTQFSISHLDATKWGIDIQDDPNRCLIYNTTTNIITGSWHSHFGAWEGGNDVLLYYDDIVQSENPVVVTTPTNTAQPARNFAIGANNTGGDALNAKLAYLVLWDVNLTSNEAEILSRGVNPFIVRNSNITLFYPIHGNDDPESQYITQIDTATVEGGGAAKFAGNPPVEHLENYL